MMKWILVLFFIYSFSTFADEITFKIIETKNKPGRILVAIFDDPNEFPDKKALLNKIIPVHTASSNYEMKVELPRGRYAVSVFLDENNNNILDKNFLGIPKERFGFSNNPSIGTGAPDFYECEIEVNEVNKKFEIKLIKLI